MQLNRRIMGMEAQDEAGSNSMYSKTSLVMSVVYDFILVFSLCY